MENTYEGPTMGDLSKIVNGDEEGEIVETLKPTPVQPAQEIVDEV